MGKKLALIHKINSLLILIVGLQFAFSVDAVSQKLQEREKSDISYKSKEKSTKKETKKKKDVKGTKKANDPVPRAKTPTGGAKTTDHASKVKGDKKDKPAKKKTKKKKTVKGTKKANDPAPRAKTPTGGAKVTPGSPKDEVSGFHSPQ